MSGDVWCVAEHHRGRLDPGIWELLAAGRKLGGRAVALVLGADPLPLAREVAARADRVLALRHEALAEFSPDLYCGAILPLARERRPAAILLLHSHYVGRDLGPMLAARLGSGMLSACIDLEWQEGLVGRRPVYRRKLLARERVVAPTPHVATCQRGAFVPAATSSSAGAIEALDVRPGPDGNRWSVVAFEEAGAGDEDITEADIVVACGRGIGSREKLAVVRELAEVLGAAVAASRPVVDQGWLDRSRQVGSSGKTVRPRLYVAVGISGAVQHVVGMRDSDVIVAVNKDPRAPIFEYADYGIVADLFDIVPRLTERIRELKGGERQA